MFAPNSASRTIVAIVKVTCFEKLSVFVTIQSRVDLFPRCIGLTRVLRKEKTSKKSDLTYARYTSNTDTHFNFTEELSFYTKVFLNVDKNAKTF